MVAPGILDRMLADAGAEQQQSERPDPGGRPDNLEGPVEDVRARAHGAYDDRAETSGMIVDGGQARAAVFFGLPLVAVGIGLGLGSALARNRRRF
jgi:hypothetical protein